MTSLPQWQPLVAVILLYYVATLFFTTLTKSVNRANTVSYKEWPGMAFHPLVWMSMPWDGYPRTGLDIWRKKKCPHLSMYMHSTDSNKLSITCIRSHMMFVAQSSNFINPYLGLECIDRSDLVIFLQHTYYCPSNWYFYILRDFLLYHIW